MLGVTSCYVIRPVLHSHDVYYPMREWYLAAYFVSIWKNKDKWSASTRQQVKGLLSLLFLAVWTLKPTRPFSASLLSITTTIYEYILYISTSVCTNLWIIKYKVTGQECPNTRKAVTISWSLTTAAPPTQPASDLAYPDWGCCGCSGLQLPLHRIDFIFRTELMMKILEVGCAVSKGKSRWQG